MTEPSHAVFLSYASQDAQAAQRICDALRAAGIEVWFDQSELRGGDVWDQKIRREIHDCALFIPIISANTASRHEGYFRLEWDLADQRSHMMARDRPFIVPVCLDATSSAGTDVPESFHRVQWTRLPAGETPRSFVERVRGLLTPAQDHAPTTTVSPAGPRSTATMAVGATFTRWKRAPLVVTTVVVMLGAAAYFALDTFSKHHVSVPGAPASAPTSSFAPPAHSIAVLPFVNMSGDKEQEYFSDGLTEELLNSLAGVRELQVAARTSAFSFKGKDLKIESIARELNVGAILEGSVRRSGQRVRVTAQLINATTGFHLWSETYDRNLSDMLAMQSDIANAVAGALKVTLLGDAAAKTEVGGTRNPAAFDAYLRASKTADTTVTEKWAQAAIAGYTDAIRLDPDYALAYAGRSHALADFAMAWARGGAVHQSIAQARSDALKAIELAPQLAEGHKALGMALYRSLEFTPASQECERAMVLAPGKAEILRECGLGAAAMGHTESALAAVRRSVVLDPLNFYSHFLLGQALTYGRRFAEAIGAYHDAIAVASTDELRGLAHSFLAFTYYSSGDLPNATAMCELAEELNKALCLAMIYDKLGRHAEAEAAFKPYQAQWGDAGAMFYSAVYAQWGQTAQALDWVEAAMRNRDPYLVQLRMDPLFDPLRKEARLQAVMRELKFPQ